MNLMDYVRYENICNSCKESFKSYGEMKLYCANCARKLQAELRLNAAKNCLPFYKVHVKNIYEKYPQIGYGHCGQYQELFCQSTWELAVAIWAFREGHSIIRSPKVIYYKFEGKQRRYYPDFEINGRTYEIKGVVTPKELAKIEAAKSQGIDIVLVDKTACEFYFEYVYSHFGLDPRIDYEKLYDKKIKKKVKYVKYSKDKIPIGKYPLPFIMKEQNTRRKREMLLNHSLFFRDKEIMIQCIRKFERDSTSPKEYIELLYQAMNFLYPLTEQIRVPYS